MQSTLDLALETAKAAGATQILSLRVRVGAMTGVVPEALQFAFEVLREQTPAAQARLDIEMLVPKAWCGACQREFESSRWGVECPGCGQPSSDLRQGLELELASVEVE
jgi:hydrogenase nickel incorporation protein HypA/HybF